MKFYVIEESPAGTVVLDREFLEPEDILYFNEEKVVIKSFGKIQLDNGWLYELEQLLSFRVGDILYDKLEFNNEIKDKIVQQVIDKFNQRSALGIAKYGTTLEQNNTDDFLLHLQEELMDAILYIQKLRNNDRSARDTV